MKSFNKLREACWKGYKAVGNKKKGDRLVPNCVPEEVELHEEEGYPYEVHVRNYDEPDDEHSTFPKDHINYGVNIHHGTYKGATDKGYVFGFREKEHANKFVQHVNTHKHTHAEHLSEEITEAVDKKDTVTVDIPLLIRLLEHAREDIKSDADLHRVVEKLISIRNNGVLTMADYDTVVSIKEEVEQFNEGSTYIKDIPNTKKVDSINSGTEKFDIHHSPERGGLHYVVHAKTGEIHHAFLANLQQTKKAIKQMGGLNNIPRPTKEEVEQIQEIGDTEKGKETLKDYKQKATLDKTYTMMRPSAPDALNDRKWKNRNFGIARAKKRLGEDGIAVAGPTNTTGSGAVAGMGQPPGSKSGEPGVHPMRKKKVVLLPMGRRTPPKM